MGRCSCRQWVHQVDASQSCDVRVMCETSDEGVELLRHDMQTLTVEGWAWPL
jgi:hypothetical protein